MNKIWTKTLIDTKVIVNFILSSFVRKVNILLQTKSNIYAVTDIDEKFLKYNKEMIDQEIEGIRLYIRSYINNIQFNIMLISRHDIMLELLWLINIDLKISFQYWIINFLIEKLVYMSKEIEELALEICIILVNKLKKKI